MRAKIVLVLVLLLGLSNNQDACVQTKSTFCNPGDCSSNNCCATGQLNKGKCCRGSAGICQFKCNAGEYCQLTTRDDGICTYASTG
jgi:hypothetical protein